MGGEKNPEVIYSNNYVRVGAIANKGEAGVLLNDDALDLIIEEMLSRIKNLYIQQAKGYLKVESLDVDYNEGQPMRIKYNDVLVEEYKNKSYATYYEYIEMEDPEFVEKM